MEEKTPHEAQKRKGQTLAEFALPLPLLLVLVFGIIEFGRVFQAWVTLQNSARTAARFASVGAIEESIFDVTDADDPDAPIDLKVLDTIVPCVEEDERGNIADHLGTEIYDGEEGLFATWYDGTDCDPTNEDHLQFRKDILRLVSIMWEARDASQSLAVQENHIVDLDADDVKALLYDTWNDPLPGSSSERGYFNTSICSSRSYIDSFSGAHVPSFAGSRFITVRNAEDLQLIGEDAPAADYPTPFCMLNEIPPDEAPDGTPRTDILNNAGRRWMDPGGPGERVTITVRFNHPLITPIGPTPMFYMEARRSAVNESFRAPKAVGAFQRSLPPGSEDSIDEDMTLTAVETETPTSTMTPSETPTNTLTPSPEPFLCEKIRIEWSESPFISNQFFMVVINENEKTTELQRTTLEWNALDDFPGMYLRAMSLENEAYWSGTAVAAAQQPQTAVDSRMHGNWIDASYRFIAGGDTAVWTGLFQNGPANLGGYFYLWDFIAEFEFSNPEGGDPCIQFLNRPDPPVPTNTPVPTDGPTPTHTPNCATVFDLEVRIDSFDTFDGSVAIRIENKSDRPTTLEGLRLVWPDPDHPDINAVPGDYYLRQITFGGDGPTDPFTQVLWESDGDGEDATGNTKTTLPYDVATNTGNTGNWLADAAVPGSSVSFVYLDFDDFSGSLTQFGVRSWHFHGSVLDIGCHSGGGGGGGGGGGEDGDVGIVEPSPTQTNTPKPTKTKGPTHTPSDTPIPKTPTLTRTAAPATNTPTDVPPTVAPSVTPFGYNTPPPSGGGE